MKYQTNKCTGNHPDRLPHACGAVFLPNKSETCPECGGNYFYRGPVLDLPDFEKIQRGIESAIEIVSRDTWPNKTSELLDLLVGLAGEFEMMDQQQAAEEESC